MKCFHRRKWLAALFFIPPFLLLGAVDAGAQSEQPNLSIQIDVAKEVKRSADNKEIIEYEHMRWEL